MSHTMADFTWKTTTWGPFISVEGWGYDIDRLSPARLQAFVDCARKNGILSMPLAVLEVLEIMPNYAIFSKLRLPSKLCYLVFKQSQERAGEQTLIL